MKNLKTPIEVKKWISLRQAKYFPGVFVDGMLSSYLKHDYIKVLQEEIIRNKIKLTGEEHQYSNKGVPLFSDNRVFKCSFRKWGRIMSQIWSLEEGVNYNYMDFSAGKGSKILKMMIMEKGSKVCQ